MKKKIILIIALILIILSIIYIGLAKYMHYTIEKDIAIEGLTITKALVNDSEIPIDSEAKNEVVDAISSATFKREFSDATFNDTTFTIFLENANNKITFKYDASGNGEITNTTTGNTVPIEVKKKLLTTLEKRIKK